MTINNIVVLVLGEVVKSFNVDAKIELSAFISKNTVSIPLLTPFLNKIYITYGHPNTGSAFLISQCIKTDLIQFWFCFKS